MTTIDNSWQNVFSTLLNLAVEKYRAVQRGSATYFTPEQTEQLAAIGHRPQELYDFAEDFVNDGVPTPETALGIATVRHDYFLQVMGGKFTGTQVSMDDLPPKDKAVDGIAWLPRLIVKAKAKLRGEMPPDLMYCCGGDRRFFKENNIDPVEFLHATWMADGDDQFVIDFVKGKRTRLGS